MSRGQGQEREKESGESGVHHSCSALCQENLGRHMRTEALFYVIQEFIDIQFGQ